MINTVKRKFSGLVFDIKYSIDYINIESKGLFDEGPSCMEKISSKNVLKKDLYAYNRTYKDE